MIGGHVSHFGLLVLEVHQLNQKQYVKGLKKDS